MRPIWRHALTITLLASCFTQHYVIAQRNDYEANTRTSSVEPQRQSGPDNVDKTPLKLNAAHFTASTEKKAFVDAEENNKRAEGNKYESDKVSEAKASAKNHREFSRLQRKEFRRALRADMKRYMIPKE